MAYLPPLWNQVDFNFQSGGYTPPSGAFILADMAGEATVTQVVLFQQVYAVGTPANPKGPFFFQQAYKVLLEFGNPPPFYPLVMSYNSVSSYVHLTHIVVERSGDEQRNVAWSIPLQEFNVAQDIQSWQDLDKIINLFKTLNGQELTFLIKDPFDFRSASINQAINNQDQFVEVSEGLSKIVQIKKTYSLGNKSKTLDIKYPDEGTVVFAVNGSPVSGIVDPNTGRIFLDVLPIKGDVITTGYEFYKRVRFGSEELNIALQNYKTGDTSLRILEVRLT